MKKPKQSAVRPRAAAKKSKGAARIVATASMLVLPLVMVSNRAVAQGAPKKTAGPTVPPPKNLTFNFAKIDVPYTIIGVAEGHTIFKTAEGTTFFVDPRSGDMKMLSADYYMKLESSRALTHLVIKGEGARVFILGVDARGNVLHKNSRGEVFFLNPQTGDMVFVKNK